MSSAKLGLKTTVWAQGLGVGLRVPGSGFTGSGFRVQGLGFEAWGLRVMMMMRHMLSMHLHLSDTASGHSHEVRRASQGCRFVCSNYRLSAGFGVPSNSEIQIQLYMRHTHGYARKIQTLNPETCKNEDAHTGLSPSCAWSTVQAATGREESC